MARIWRSHSKSRPSAFRSIPLLWRLTSACLRVGTFGGTEANPPLFLFCAAPLCFITRTKLTSFASLLSNNELWIEVSRAAGAAEVAMAAGAAEDYFQFAHLQTRTTGQTSFSKDHTGAVLDCRLTLEPLQSHLNVWQNECRWKMNASHWVTLDTALSSGPCTSSLRHGRAVLLSFTGVYVLVQLRLSITLSLPHCHSLSIRYALAPDHLLKSALSWWAAGGERETERTGILLRKPKRRTLRYCRLQRGLERAAAGLRLWCFNHDHLKQDRIILGHRHRHIMHHFFTFPTANKAFISNKCHIQQQLTSATSLNQGRLLEPHWIFSNKLKLCTHFVGWGLSKPLHFLVRNKISLFLFCCCGLCSLSVWWVINIQNFF